jgi:LPS export ABC transporter protein LptC|tara:strand:+ start:661 stop:1245 length:585 start_codon:yes stop_codon:yes gene_type:complete
MKKKTLAQNFFLIIIAVLVFLVYNKYFSNKNSNISTKITYIDENTNSSEKSNIVYDIKYVSYDNNGGKYTITADRGEINNEDKNLTLMKEVNATILLKDLSPINFWSNEAIYNNINYTTEFYGNVLMTYMEHDIKSDNLSLDFSKNLATVSNNVLYKNLNTSLKADRVKIDLLTKDTKIYMIDKLKKIKVISAN